MQERKVGRPSPYLAVVRDVMEWSELPLTLAAGASGLDRPLRTAHATELVDPRRFLRGDELIMTVGNELIDDEACERFVANLMSSRAAGIALAVGVDGYPTPPGLAPAAERAGLPMFYVPVTVPFLALTEKLQSIAEGRSEHIRLCREEGRMLDHVRRGFASAQVFRERFPTVGGVEYAALCMPAEVSLSLEGVVIEGWIDEITVVIADERVVRQAPKRAGLVVYGTGSGVGPEGLARTLREGLAALAIASRRGHSAGPRDLSTFSGLLERLTPEQFQPFEDHIVKPLLRHDAKHGRSLWPTLVAFIEADASMTATADRLGIHANSVRHRMVRITDITGRDPHRLEDQFALGIAVRGVARRG